MKTIPVTFAQVYALRPDCLDFSLTFKRTVEVEEMNEMLDILASSLFDLPGKMKLYLGGGIGGFAVEKGDACYLDEQDVSNVLSCLSGLPLVKEARVKACLQTMVWNLGKVRF